MQQFALRRRNVDRGQASARICRKRLLLRFFFGNQRRADVIVHATPVFYFEHLTSLTSSA